MSTETFMQLLAYTLPALVTGLVALYFFKLHTDNEKKRHIYQLRKEKQSIALPSRFQAYERMALFLERISPNNLAVRIKPSGNDKPGYFKKLLGTVEQEYEHNLAQQIYMTSECWDIITTAKNNTLNFIRDVMLEGEVLDAKAMREAIIQRTGKDDLPPTRAALDYIKEEVQSIF
ncbi:MAG: hypothetical protein QNJ57_09925 [Flavobacteriaceae bacterium]|nr:hypothetical protein [Flavobacteriaceae bacterium]